MSNTGLMSFSGLLAHYAWCDARIDGCWGEINFRRSDGRPYLKKSNGEDVPLNVGDILSVGKQFVLLTHDDRYLSKRLLDLIYRDG